MKERMPGCRPRRQGNVDAVRKFIFSGTMLSAVFGGWSTIQATRKGPRDWRLALLWVIWGLTVAVAVGTVLKEQDIDELEE